MKDSAACTKSRRRQILIYGYSRMNLGDDLFFKILVERYPTVDFYMLSEVDYRKIIHAPNFHLIRRNRINKIFAAHIPYQFYFKRFDAVICIGGSIFMEVGESGRCRFTRFLIDYKRKFPGVPIHIIGSNYGPARTSAFRESVNGIFSFVDSVCLRDSASYNIFKANRSVTYAPDVIFQLGNAVADTERTEQSGVVGFSVIDLPSRSNLCQYAEPYEEFLVYHIRKSIEEGKRVRLFSFCDYERDVEACNRLIDRVELPLRDKVEIVPYNGDIEAFLALFRGVDMLFASRFHAAVLGILYRIPTVPVVYSDKTINVLSDLKYGGDIVDIRNMGDIHRSLRVEVLDSVAVEALSRESQTQFRGVDRMLGEERVNTDSAV